MVANYINYITNHGVAFVVTAVFLAQNSLLFKKVFDLQDKTLTVLARIDKNVNSEVIRGKALEMLLNLKLQELRWSLQNRITKYIKNNNIAKNWDVISREINVSIEEKKVNLQISLKDIVESVVLKNYLKNLTEELLEIEGTMLKILEELKNSEVKEDYEIAQRAVENHFENFENHMIHKINELLN